MNALVLHRSTTTSARRRRNGQHRPVVSPRRKGIALVMAMIAVAILGVMLSDLYETTSSSLLVATAERDQLKAEYLAKSSINLTRLLVAREPEIRQMAAPMYQMVFGRAPPQLPVWTCANDILQPFISDQGAIRASADLGFDLSQAEGLADPGGKCEIISLAENSKININSPLRLGGDQARKSVAMQLFGLMGGYQLQSAYDPIFENPDPDGQHTTRLDIVSDTIDWWDLDQDRTVFDPGAASVSSSGSEDDIYRSYHDPYQVKNAPFDSLQEFRLIRGVGDDFWATFVEPNSDDPTTRTITIYGSGSVNPNEAGPEVILARLCSYISDQPLCSDPVESAKFIQLVNTFKSLAGGVPPFTRVSDFLNFVEGKGGEKDLYQQLVALLGPKNPLLFRPVTVPAAIRTQVDSAFVTAAQILTIQAKCNVKRSSVRLNTVVNFHDRWTPPPPNSGTMPGLGVFHYYRLD